LITIEKNTHLGDRIISALDEGRLSALDTWIKGWIAFDDRVIDPKSFHHIVSRVIRGISLHGSAVILGRGANFVLRGSGAFRVRLIAPLDLLSRSVEAGVEGIGPMARASAIREIEKHMDRRRSFIRKHFRADINDPAAYDVVFNLNRLDPDHAAGFILDAYRRQIQ
jgi:cytidylate kinase